MADQKSPPSEMIRVPVPLIGAVRQLSKLHRQGHTIALLQALEELVATFDSDLDIDLVSSKPVKSLSEKLEKLESHLTLRDKSVESKLSAITTKLEQLERTVASTRYNNKPRSKSYTYPYQQAPVELLPRNSENLAKRLALSPQSLIAEREKLNAKEFLSYTRNRDPMGVGWEWNEKDEMYHPIR